MQKSSVSSFHWACKHTWNRSAKNTAWCLLGCSIGDFGTILFFQLTKIPFPVLGIMTLAIINGLITSIILETIILMKQKLSFSKALNTAIGMSFISMISMEIAMNATDYLSYWWCNTNLVGNTNNVNSGFSNTLAIQLLEIKKI